MKCFGTGTFGPVVSLYRFHDEADAIARVSQGSTASTPRSTAVTGDRAVARQIKSARSSINEAFAATFASLDAPDGRHARVRHGSSPGAEGVRSELTVGAAQLRFAPPSACPTRATRDR